MLEISKHANEITQSTITEAQLMVRYWSKLLSCHKIESVLYVLPNVPRLLFAVDLLPALHHS